MSVGVAKIESSFVVERGHLVSKVAGLFLRSCFLFGVVPILGVRLPQFNVQAARYSRKLASTRI